MEHRRLGRTALRVSELCLGTMNFGPLTTQDDSFAIMDRALDLGINFFDTANRYGGPKGAGTTETIIGPKTMEQLDGLLGAAEVTLDTDTLDRIDEIVPPGRTLHAPDDGYDSPHLAASARRR